MALPPRLPESLRRLPVAHRGLHDSAAGRPENSLAAVRAAVSAGYAIEIDLQLSADHQAVVFHDYTLPRLTGQTGRLRDLTLAQLQTLRLTGSQEGVPSFADLLACVAGRVPLLVEIKDQHGAMGPTDCALEAATVAALAGYTGDVALMSFNPHSVARLAQLAPQLPRGLTTAAFRPEDWAPLPPATCGRLRDISDYDRCGASFISHQGSDLARPRVAELAAGGADILCWTIRSATEEARCREIACNITFEGYRPAIPPAR